LPALAVGGTPALASYAAAGAEGTGAGTRKRAAFCVQRHVEALLRSHAWGRLGAHSNEAAQRLKHMRWPLLRRGSRVRGRARQKLNALLASKLATARAWDLKETFSHFWQYKSVMWAGAFLDYWCFRSMRSRLEPMKQVARMLRAHEPLILNWFRAKGEVSNGAVEGLNNKIRVVTRRSYGFRTFKAMEIALYHNLGRLPEPESPHRFC
jgi:transposase